MRAQVFSRRFGREKPSPHRGETEGAEGRSPEHRRVRGITQANNLTEIKAPTGALTSITYDRHRLPVTVTNPAGDVTRYTHDERGRLTSVTDPMGRNLQATWTPRHDLAQVTQADRVTSFQHDLRGRRIATTDPLGRQERRELDAAGHLVKHQRFDGEIIARTFDDEGNPLEQTDSQGRTTRIRYGGLGQLTQHQDPMGHKVKLFYDSEAELIRVENQHGEPYTFELDQAGKVKREVTFSGTKRLYTFDPAGRVTKIVTGAYRVTQLERDALGRIVKQATTSPVLGGAPTEETFQFDEHGRLQQATTPGGDVTFQRDVLGRITEERAASTTVHNTYDRSGLRLQRTTSFAHKTEYQYNAFGDLTQVEAAWDLAEPLKRLGLPQATAEPFQIKIARDRLGQELARRLPGGVTAVWTRDTFGRATQQRTLTGASSQSPGVDIATRTYAWQGPDQIAAITTTGPDGSTVNASQYEYDPRGHLIRQLFASGEVLERSSDAAGNLFKTAQRSDRTYGRGGVILRNGNTLYETDADGFLTKKTLSDGAVWRYDWDAHGQLSKVTRPDGRTAEYRYDAFGRRTSKTFDGQVTEFVWDGDDLVHERVRDSESGEAQPVTTWVFEPGMFTPLAKIEGRKRYGIVSDHLGSPTMLATEAGKIAWRAQLDVYGVPREEAGVAEGERTANPWRYPGQYEDAETGLYYNRFRYYDPELGRYLSEDPIGLLGGAALYGYVHEPLWWRDPLGLSCNLASPARTTHILVGDATGGGHLWPGLPGKSPFPRHWDADKVMEVVSDIATDPSASIATGRSGRSLVQGTREGTDVLVVLESPSRGGGIVTAFPTNVPRNPP